MWKVLTGQPWMARWTRDKGAWTSRLLHLHCDFIFLWKGGSRDQWHSRYMIHFVLTFGSDLCPNRAAQGWEMCDIAEAWLKVKPFLLLPGVTNAIHGNFQDCFSKDESKAKEAAKKWRRLLKFTYLTLFYLCFLLVISWHDKAVLAC